MSNDILGRILAGEPADVRVAYAKFDAQPVDLEWHCAEAPSAGAAQATVARAVSVSGPGTFFGKAKRTLTFEPCATEGWWFQRTDLPDALPIRVSVNNVWTTVRNIVLLSGSPHNYMRMVEHIIALRLGLAVDNVLIRMDSGDPPLFDRGSMDLVEALDSAGRQAAAAPARFVTVREPVTVGGAGGAFLTLRPCRPGDRRLNVDCAIDFRSAIGRQRLRVTVTPESFRYGAVARTNTTLGMMLFVRTLGKLFADTRNLGYTPRNILVAGPRHYINEPNLPHNGKSLEAVWHRTMLDLVAALALIDRGRFVGDVLSYKAGHALDVAMVRKLYEQGCLVDA